MDEPRTDLTKALVRDGLRGKGAGTPALHIMGWANAWLDREEDETEPMHSPSGEEGTRPMDRPRPALRIIRARPFLAVLDGGKRRHHASPPTLPRTKATAASRAAPTAIEFRNWTV